MFQSLPQLKISGDGDLETLLSEVLGEMDRRESSPSPPLTSDDVPSPQPPLSPSTPATAIPNGNENVSSDEVITSEGELEEQGEHYLNFL